MEMPARRPVILTEADQLFLRSLSENVRRAFQIRPRPATSFQVHYLLIILTLDAIASSAKQIIHNCILKELTL
jgi:hypothetical protein